MACLSIQFLGYNAVQNENVLKITKRGSLESAKQHKLVNKCYVYAYDRYECTKHQVIRLLTATRND